ncbi:MAG: hypothetical protein JSS66_03730 [Armatimonadetes bacterium]|nr:hypothetical protein [Armatimonadota bacterium]
MRQETQAQEGSPDETLTPEEVSAILSRYGEQQAGEPVPRLSDVAETLQVDRSVVSQLLRDIRGANTEKQLRERLDRLEREHEELRSRAALSESDVGHMFGTGHWRRRRNRQRREVSLVAIVLTTAIAAVIAQKGGHMPPSEPAFMALFAVIGIMLFMRRFRT